MRKVLVVGLGGSGAKTVSLMMDELLAELKSNYKWESNTLPACWKFLSIDVPEYEEALNKLAKPIGKKGGKYLGLAQDATTKYSSYEGLVFDKFQLAHDPSHGHFGLQEYARWKATHAFGNTISLEGGAGAFRAIGRVMTLAASEKIYGFLKENVKELMASDAEGVKLAQAIGANWNAGQTPLILLIASVAGGSGASMLLDVSDLLNGLSAEVPGFKGDLSSAFIYTPEVFGSIEKVANSGGGIALAAISELLSARSKGMAPWSESYVTWKSLLPNVQVPDQSQSVGRGPYLTFPIGASTNGVPFGNSPEDVYRGFARVLSPLLTDEKQQEEFNNYVTVNYPKHLLVAAKDNTGLAGPVRRQASGVQTHPVFFGGFGSSKLATGRTRYREYSAQRIARRAVEILVNGFVDPMNPAGNPTALKATAAENFTAQFFAMANIDGRRSSETSLQVGNLLNNVLKSRSNIDALAADQISKMAPVLRGETSGEAGLNGFKRNWDAETATRKQVSKQIAAEALESWSQEVLANIERAYLAANAVYGLEVSELLLTRLATSLNELGGSLNATPKFESAAQDAVSTFFKNVRSAGKVNWDVENKRLNPKLGEIIEGLVKNEAYELLKDILAELAGPVLDQLKRGGKNLLAELQEELAALPSVVSTAAFREAPVDAWPTSDHVPTYFEPAVNEVLLTKTDTYARTFKDHLEAETGIDQLDAALKKAAQLVILKAELPRGTEELKLFTTWDHDEVRGSHPHLVRTNPWAPTRISNPPTVPGFKLLLGSADLKEYANKWIGVNKSAFDQYCTQSLTEWISLAPGNEEKLKQLLEEAINFAKPLVTIDDGAAKFFHDHTMGTELEFVFSSLPFARNSATVTELTARGSQQYKDAINDACDPAKSRTEITIFSRFEKFYYPWAMESLTAPIRKSFQTLKTAGMSEAFFNLQRSRTLPMALPVANDVIEAMLRGYFIGRITGRLTVEKDSAKIFVQPNPSQPGSWVEFSKDLLGGKSLGIGNGGESTDKLNIPVVLLESLPLALVKVYGSSTESMTPYLEMFRLGKNLKAKGYGVRGEEMTELDEWFVGEGGFTPLTKEAPRSEELKAEAAKLLNLWAFRAKEQWDNPPGRNEYDYQIFGELAPQLIAAAEELVAELNRSEPSLGEFSASAPRAVAEATPTFAPEDDVY